MVRSLKKEDWFHADGLPIVVERRDPQRPFGLHTHEFSEIVFVTGGSGLHITGENSWQLAAGDTFVIGGSRPHDYADMSDLRLINVLFLPNELPLDTGDLAALPGYRALFMLEPAWRRRHQFRSRLHLSPGDLTAATGLIDRLDQELVKRVPGFCVVATAVFLQLVVFLSRCYGRSRNSDSKSLLRIAEAISYLETHYAEAINLDELAEISQMSKRSFLRAFEAAMGCPPITYLIQLRIRQASSMLCREEQSVTDIAYAVGFNDSNYFSRQFRKFVGTSPREYRKREHAPPYQATRDSTNWPVLNRAQLL